MIPNSFKRIGTRIVYCLIICICFTACSTNAVKPNSTSSSSKEKTDEIQSSGAGKLTFSKATKVARVTGATLEGETLPNPNRTDELYQVNGTDLGILWDAGGIIMTVFGDTFGFGWTGPGGNGNDWRSNVLAISSDKNLADGLSFSSMITEPNGFAKQIIESFHDTSGDGDFTSIPTAGISVGSRNFIHYMNVKAWGNPGYWTTNFSELVYSDDNGQNWIPSGVKWGASSNFAQVALTKESSYVYMLGTPSGRQGNICLARVPQDSILYSDKYEYWDGKVWIAGKEDAAAAIVQGPVAELSVQYNSHFKRWIMCYLNESIGQIVTRDAQVIVGPWSDEKSVADSTDYPGMYGSFIHPWTNDGTDLYFTMSQWDPYNVFLMHSKISIK